MGVAGACGHAQRTFYVSPSGSDTDPGSSAAPFASLWRAREAVRSQPLTQRSTTCVILSAGTYEIEETLRFTGALQEVKILLTFLATFLTRFCSHLSQSTIAVHRLMPQ